MENRGYCFFSLYGHDVEIVHDDPTDVSLARTESQD